MSGIQFQAHKDSLTDLIELMTVAGWLAVLADCLWIIRDSYVNNWPISLIVIGVVLLTAFMILSKALYTYHRVSFRQHLKDLLHTKLKISKSHYKSNKKHTNHQL